MADLRPCGEAPTKPGPELDLFHPVQGSSHVVIHGPGPGGPHKPCLYIQLSTCLFSPGVILSSPSCQSLILVPQKSQVCEPKQLPSGPVHSCPVREPSTGPPKQAGITRNGKGGLGHPLRGRCRLPWGLIWDPPESVLPVQGPFQEQEAYSPVLATDPSAPSYTDFASLGLRLSFLKSVGQNRRYVTAVKLPWSPPLGLVCASYLKMKDPKLSSDSSSSSLLPAFLSFT